MVGKSEKYTNCLYLVLLLGLLISACQDDANPMDPEKYNAVAISENPIYIHDSINEKYFYFRAPRSLKDKIVLRAAGDTLTPRVISQTKLTEIVQCEVKITKAMAGNKLTMAFADDKANKYIHELDIIKYNSNDTIDFVKFHYMPARPAIILRRECWPDYTGHRIGPDYDFTISSRAYNEDIVKGDSITRILKLEKVRLVDNEKRKSYDIDAPLYFEYKDRNWLNLVSSQENIITSPTDPMKYGIYSDEGGFPDYMLIGDVIGAQIKMVSKSPYKNDTLQINDMFLPTNFQIGLDCQSQVK